MDLQYDRLPRGSWLKNGASVERRAVRQTLCMCRGTFASDEGVGQKTVYNDCKNKDQTYRLYISDPVLQLLYLFLVVFNKVR